VSHSVTGPIFSAATISFFTVILCSWIHRKSIAAPSAAWRFPGSDLVKSTLSRRPQLASNCGAPIYAAIVPSRWARVVAVLAMPTALLLSSCHGTVADRHVTDPAQRDKPEISGEPAGHNDHDISFGNSMIAYDQQGTDMSALVPDRSVNPTVVAFAAKGEAALRADIATLKATFARLGSLRGRDFNSLWLQSMISLNKGAIEISRAELASGENVDFIVLARRILDARQAEISQLNQMLNDTS